MSHDFTLIDAGRKYARAVGWRAKVKCALLSLVLAAGLSTGLGVVEAASDSVEVVRIEGGPVLLLAGGETVALAGLEPVFDDPHAARAVSEARRRIGSGPVRLRDTRRDRHGRLSAQVETAEGVWLQEALLRAGLARFLGGLEDAETIRALRAAETSARTERRGLWADPGFAVRRAERYGWVEPGFAIVEGRVLRAARVGDRVYLNFGEDWREDFTASWPARRMRDFAEAGFDPESLDGAQLRMRGWVRFYNGPFMEIHAPDQIERLD